jgi:hypothetical protein
MAQEGFCSACGRNVPLTSEGACTEGHGPECIADPREAPDAGSEPLEGRPAPIDTRDAVPAPSASVEAAPAPPVSVAPRNRAGLIMVVVAILLIFVACVATALLLVPAVRKAGVPTAATAVSAERAKMQVSIGFMEALLTNDTMRIKPYFTAAAQAAATATQWATIASVYATGSATFDAPVWTGGTHAVVRFASADSSGTLTFVLEPAKPNDVVVKGVSGSASETDTVVVIRDGGAWRVHALASQGGGTTTYDPAFVKQMAKEAATN